MTLQASKDENSSWKLFLMLFHSSEYQISCLSPGRSHMQIRHSVKLGQSWFFKNKGFPSLCCPSCSLLSMLPVYGTEEFSEPWSYFLRQAMSFLSCRLTWIENKQAPWIPLYSDSVKSSFKILSQGLFQRALTGFAITRKAAVMHSGNELEDTPAC